MSIRWTIAAASDLTHIHVYLTKHHPALAHSTIMAIRESVVSLKLFPHRGRKGRIEDTRELLHDRLPYIVVYRINGDTIDILHIQHEFQNY